MRDIQEGEELSFDYGNPDCRVEKGRAEQETRLEQGRVEQGVMVEQETVVTSIEGSSGETGEGAGVKRSLCYCRTARCRGFLPFDPDLL